MENKQSPPHTRLFWVSLQSIRAYMQCSIRHLISILFVFILFAAISILPSGCAQIGSPTGGPKDSLPPQLVRALPALKTTNFNSNRITLTFNEFVDVKEVQQNLLVSPLMKVQPTVEAKLKTITIKIKDTLEANTTYALNFGDAIVDNNEGNPLRNFTYVFSTGPTIDSLELDGSVLIAENNKTDSTIVALLYRGTDDSAVVKRKADYLARVDKDGKFRFTNLAAGPYKLYALKDGDGGKYYNISTELFGFVADTLYPERKPKSVQLYVSAREKEMPKASTRPAGSTEKRMRYNTSFAASANRQELTAPLRFTFNKPLVGWDSTAITLTDTNYITLPKQRWSLDSTRTVVTLAYNFPPDQPYFLLVRGKAFKDSTGLTIDRTDTLSIRTKAESDYGNLVLRFKNFKNDTPLLLQFVKSNEVVYSSPVTAAIWSNKLFTPGDYELRLLFDTNKNGQWDPGDYFLNRQPERIRVLDEKLGIRANWDNEREISL